MKREPPIIVGLKAIEDQQTEIKYYSAKEIFELQKERDMFFLYVLDDDGLNAYNVKSKKFENGKYYVTAEIPHVAHLLNKLPEC